MGRIARRACEAFLCTFRVWLVFFFFTDDGVFFVLINKGARDIANEIYFNIDRSSLTIIINFIQ